MAPRLVVSQSASTLPAAYCDASGATSVVHVSVSAPQNHSHHTPEMPSHLPQEAFFYLPLDLVVCVDTSGSMHGEPLHVVKAALLRLVDMMQPQDRLSIVPFSSVASTLFPLVHLADEATRQAAKDAVEDELHPGGHTNLEDALLTALDNVLMGDDGRPLTARDGRVRQVWLLTDGVPNEGACDARVLRMEVEEYLRLQPVRVPCVVHAIGLGCDHDGLFLQQLRYGPSARYCFLRTAAELDDLYRELARSAQTVLYDGLQLRLHHADGNIASLASAFPVRYDAPYWVVDFGPLSAAESRDLLVYLHQPETAELPDLGIDLMTSSSLSSGSESLPYDRTPEPPKQTALEVLVEHRIAEWMARIADACPGTEDMEALFGACEELLLRASRDCPDSAVLEARAAQVEELKRQVELAHGPVGSPTSDSSTQNTNTTMHTNMNTTMKNGKMKRTSLKFSELLQTQVAAARTALAGTREAPPVFDENRLLDAALVRAVSQHLRDADIQKAFCSHVVSSNPINVAASVPSDDELRGAVVDTLRRAMEAHMDDETLLERAFGALGLVLGCRVDEAVRSGVLPLARRVLMRHGGAVGVVRGALSFLVGVFDSGGDDGAPIRVARAQANLTVAGIHSIRREHAQDADIGRLCDALRQVLLHNV